MTQSTAVFTRSKNRKKNFIARVLLGPDVTKHLIVLVLVFLFGSAATVAWGQDHLDLSTDGAEISARLEVMKSKVDLMPVNEAEVDNLRTGIEHMQKLLGTIVKSAESIRLRTQEELKQQEISRRAVF